MGMKTGMVLVEPGGPVPPRHPPALVTRAEPLHLGHNAFGHNNNHSKESL